MRSEHGFSLLELLIASTVLAVALLGLGQLAVRVLEDSASLRDHALADLLLADLQARGALVGTLDPDAADVGALAHRESRDWQAQASTLLPSGRSEWCRHGSTPVAEPLPRPCDGSGMLIVRLSWQRFPGDEPDWRQAPIQP